MSASVRVLLACIIVLMYVPILVLCMNISNPPKYDKYATWFYISHWFLCQWTRYDETQYLEALLSFL